MPSGCTCVRNRIFIQLGRAWKVRIGVGWARPFTFNWSRQILPCPCLGPRTWSLREPSLPPAVGCPPGVKSDGSLPGRGDDTLLTQKEAACIMAPQAPQWALGGAQGPGRRGPAIPASSGGHDSLPFTPLHSPSSRGSLGRSSQDESSHSFIHSRLLETLQ